jgi:hypothetical protein
VAQRTFTPDEANALLPRIRPLVERLVESRADLLAVQARQAEVASLVGGNGGGLDPGTPASLQQSASEAEQRLQETLSELTELGVVVKDLDAGLVDFPSTRDDTPVYLCWQLGEERVAYWHGLEEGFAGRTPI